MRSFPDAAVRDAYAAHGAELFRFARRALGDTGLAEEAVQETFVRAWRAARSYDPARASQRTWLFAILRNVVIDLARARRVRPAVAGDDGTPSITDDGIDAALTAWQVDAALAELGRDHRRALVEVHWRGRPYAEVAAELGIPEGTVKSRVYHGLRALRRALEAQGWSDA
ncbi:MAG TPA: sigma-70 family RNA polymerase sigma factor [Acidimicrobiales bacterium]|nr:sigma-70 family RNA polymerase sigma factor [Acidimicrobiales bacterium]